MNRLAAALTLALAATLAGPATPAVAAAPAWPAFATSVSADGGVVVFIQPEASPYSTGYDVYFARDVRRGLTIPLGFTPDATPLQPEAVVSGDGRYVVLLMLTADDPITPRLVRYDLASRRYEPITRPNARAAYDPAVSADGRYVAFTSDLPDLVPGDTNGAVDVFVRDLRLGTTSRVSVNSTGHQGDAASNHPSISADGRLVAFASAASNLIADDWNEAVDVFVRDRRFGGTHRIDVDSGGHQSDGHSVSDKPAISADGRYVAFTSDARNLVGNDTNNAVDVFVHDLRHRTTNRVDVDSHGRQAATPDGLAGNNPTISADGRYVAFESPVALAAGDAGYLDVYIRDLRFGATRLASVGNHGQGGNGSSTRPLIDGDGRHVVFSSDATNLGADSAPSMPSAFERDLWAHTIRRVSIDTGATAPASPQESLGSPFGRPTGISRDGRIVAFMEGTGGCCGDYYVSIAWLRDLAARRPAPLARLNASSLGLLLSADARYVAFDVEPDYLTRPSCCGYTRSTPYAGIRDRATGSTTLVGVDDAGRLAGGSSVTSMSANGRYVVLTSAAALVPGDTNQVADVYVRDTWLGTTRRVSVDRRGNQVVDGAGNGMITADGRYVIFYAWSPLAPGTGGGIFVRDLLLGTIGRVDLTGTGAPPNSVTTLDGMSADGRYLLVDSYATNLVPGDSNGAPDVFVHDRVRGTTVRASVADGGRQADSSSADGAISADGRYVVFDSYASNLVAGDTNGKSDVFVRDLLARTTTRVSVGVHGAQADNQSNRPAISADGRFVAFNSMASNLTHDPRSWVYGDVYEVDRRTHSIVKVNAGLP